MGRRHGSVSGYRARSAGAPGRRSANWLPGHKDDGAARAFPAAFNSLCDGSTEIRYGFDAKFPVTEQFRLIGTLEGVHRFESSGSNVTGQVVGLGGFNLGAANFQQDWLRAGAGFEVDISGSTLSIMGNATTKGESSNAWVAANWRMTF